MKIGVHSSYAILVKFGVHMYYNNIVPCSHDAISPPQADTSVGDGGSSGESDMESQPIVERDGERVTMETIHGWVQSATGKVSKQCIIIPMMQAFTCVENCAPSNRELVNCVPSQVAMLTMSC